MTPLRQIRKHVLGLNVQEMAAVVGVSQGTISKWENDQHGPSLDHLMLIRAHAARRGIDWSDGWFFGDPVPTEKPEPGSEVVGGCGALAHDGETAADSRSGHAISVDAALRAEAGR